MNITIYDCVHECPMCNKTITSECSAIDIPVFCPTCSTGLPVNELGWNGSETTITSKPGDGGPVVMMQLVSSSPRQVNLDV